MTNLIQQFSDNLLTTSARHESKSANLIPVDLLIDIFSRVPGESIARFRCVSKFWASILRRPDFNEMFLTRSLTRPRILFALEADDGKLFFYSSTLPHNPDDRNSSLVATSYYTSFPNYFPSDICKTVCGLCLLEGYSRKVRVICNPATGGFITLPKVLLKEKNLPKVKAKSNPMKIARMFFGYDPIGKQFKVLCMTSSDYERPNTHQVLTLKAGKKRVWRPVEHEFHFVENRRMYGEICINGVLYFGAAFGHSSIIVCFNIGSEKFGFINTNEDMSLDRNYICCSLTLFNYKGKLCIRHRDTYGNRLLLWVLEDAGNHKWSKHNYELSPLERFVGMTCTGEIVWSSYHEPFNPFYLFFYNLERNTVTRVNIQGFDEFKHHDICIDTFLDYVENMKLM